AIQDEIASQVGQALASSIDASAGRAIPLHGTEKLDAWLAYLQGRALIATRRLADLVQAKDPFAQAVRGDPSVPSAYVGLAEAHLLDAYFAMSEFWFFNGPNLSTAEQAQIEELLDHALALDPKSGEAYLLRAWLEQDYPSAEADYRRGLALSPNSAA